MGNLTTYCVGTPTEDKSKPTPMSGNYGKGACIVGPDGEMVISDGGVTKVSTADLSNGLPGVLSTAKTPAGTPTNIIQDDTIVTVNGQQLRADLAARFGWIKRDSAGRYL